MIEEIVWRSHHKVIPAEAKRRRHRNSVRPSGLGAVKATAYVIVIKISSVGVNASDVDWDKHAFSNRPRVLGLATLQPHNLIASKVVFVNAIDVDMKSIVLVLRICNHNLGC